MTQPILIWETMERRESSRSDLTQRMISVLLVVRSERLRNMYQHLYPV